MQNCSKITVMGNRITGGVNELGGRASVDLIIRHLQGRIRGHYSINANITCPLTSCVLICHSNQVTICRDARASNYRLGGKDTGEDVREEMLCTGRLMRILYTLSVACRPVCVCLCSKEMQEVKL